MCAYRAAGAQSLSQAHYADADLYDRRYARRRDDLDFYTQHVRGRCLEIGAGTGRVTRALLPHVQLLRAIEPSAAMRKQLLSSLRADGVVGRRAREQRSNVANVWRGVGASVNGEPARAYDCAVAAFNVFSHCLESNELVALLSRLRACVVPGGRLLFDVPQPDVGHMLVHPDRRYKLGTATIGGTRYAYTESFDYDAATQLQLVLCRYTPLAAPGQKRAEARVLPLLQRMYFPLELRFLLETAGWSIESHAGGFHGEPLTVDCDSQVLVCRAKPLRRAR